MPSYQPFNSKEGSVLTKISILEDTVNRKDIIGDFFSVLTKKTKKIHKK